MYWTRFQTAQMWGQIAMLDWVGGPIASGKLDQARASAIAACGVNGIIDDPRTCHFDAKANICGKPTAPPTNCLTDQEAKAIDLIWDGPRNKKGERIWFPLDRGTDFVGPFPGFGLDGSQPFFLGVIQFEWDEHNQNFNWQTVDLGLYPQVAQDGSRNIADVTDTFKPLDGFKGHGGKMITSVGANDQLIFPRGVINYYREMASRYSTTGEPDFKNLQNFYRLFRAPGVGHCGSDDTGPWPQNGADFQALINWVENGIVPSQIIGSTAPGVTPALTRPLCPYPQTAIYNGTGDPDNAANWHCGGNLETPATVCADVLVQYKHEVNGDLDFQGTGVSADICEHFGGEAGHFR